MSRIPIELMTSAELAKSIIARLEDAVCTVGCDRGVIMLSEHGPTHPEVRDGKTIQVYDHVNFSPLGDAMIEIHDGLKILLSRLEYESPC